MKKLVLLMACGIFNFMHGQSSTESFIYRQELDRLKNAEQYKTIFNKHMPADLRYLQRDIHNYGTLTFTQRLVRSVFLACDTIVVTPETMPALYAYTKKVCDTANIPMPVIFITRKKALFNAAAHKFLASTGSIIIGQKLLYEVNDDELEATVAHEIGHIKHNHVNKHLAIGLTVYISAPIIIEYLVNACMSNEPINATRNNRIKIAVFYLTASLLPSLIVNKRFEKEADRFACEAMGKASGVSKFFTRLQQIEKEQDQAYDRTKEMIHQNKKTFGSFLHARFMISYYAAKCGHVIDKGFKWLYDNTPLGAHPSHAERVRTAEEYLKAQPTTALA